MAAIGHFEQALRLNPESAELHNNIGIALRRLNRQDEAIEHYRKLVRSRPEVFRSELAGSLNNLGFNLNDLGRHKDALHAAEEATQGFVYKTGTWHSLDRYILSPPGASFVILNVDPNPTQVVDYATERGITFEVDL